MNAVRMIGRCAKYQSAEARHPTVEEIKPTYSVESTPRDTEYIPEAEPMGNGEVA